MEGVGGILDFIVGGMGEEWREDREFDDKVNMVKKECLKNDIEKVVVGGLKRLIGNGGIEKCGLKVICCIVDFGDGLEMLWVEGGMD